MRKRTIVNCEKENVLPEGTGVLYRIVTRYVLLISADIPICNLETSGDVEAV